jgi:DNA-directed RNA polymerase-3 subunit RPC5
VQLHLNTIHAVVQLRPSLENLKSGGSKKKNNVAVDAEATVKVEESHLLVQRSNFLLFD